MAEITSPLALFKLIKSSRLISLLLRFVIIGEQSINVSNSILPQELKDAAIVADEHYASGE
jgi:hypothetical protein